MSESDVVQTSPQNQKSNEVSVPISPDMKNARYRLGNLLHGIRRGDITSGTVGDKDDEHNESTSETSAKRGPGRPKRPKKERRIIFDLRSKSFAVRDAYEYESTYAMMRKWVYGKDDDLPLSEEHSPPTPSIAPVEESLDLMATKEIYRLPDPLPETEPVPSMCVTGDYENERLPEGADTRELLEEGITAWKSCRKKHRDYMNLKEKRFEPSMTLFKTVHNLIQQTNQ